MLELGGRGEGRKEGREGGGGGEGEGRGGGGEGEGRGGGGEGERGGGRGVREGERGGEREKERREGGRGGEGRGEEVRGREGGREGGEGGREGRKEMRGHSSHLSVQGSQFLLQRHKQVYHISVNIASLPNSQNMLLSNQQTSATCTPATREAATSSAHPHPWQPGKLLPAVHTPTHGNQGSSSATHGNQGSSYQQCPLGLEALLISHLYGCLVQFVHAG